MVDSIKDKSGRIIGYIEWSLRNKFGIEDMKGEYGWIGDIWIHEDFRRNGLIRRLIKLPRKRAPNAEYVYWNRAKYMTKHGKRKSQYSIKDILKEN